MFNREISASVECEASPEITCVGDVRTLTPGKGITGDASFMVNEYGMVFCLMRDYRPDSKNHSTSVEHTRYDGAESLFESLAEVTNLHGLRVKLADIDLVRFNPFQLTVFPGPFPPLQWHWDGADWKEVTAVPPIITTSSCVPEWTQMRRIRIFRKGTGDYRFTLDDERHLALHRRCASRFRAASAGRAAFAFRKTSAFWRTSAIRKASAFKWLSNRRDLSVYRIRVEEATIRMSRHSGGQDSRSDSVCEVQMPRKTGPAMQRRIIMPEPYNGKLIDIERVLYERSPELYKKIPGWMFRLIRVIINEKRLNRYLDDVSDRPGNFLASNILHHLEVQAEIRPPAGPISSAEVRPVTKPGRKVMFMANHPTGGLDGLLLLHWLSGYYPDIRIIVNDLLFTVPHLRPWLVPVDIYRPGRESMARLREAFDDDAPLLVYPAGYAARRIKGELVEAQWKKMPIKLAREHKRSIVLIHIDGYNSKLFNSVAWIRRTAGIRMNLELLFLSRALTNPACKCYNITIGPTVSPDEIVTLGKTDRDRAAKLQQKCTLLAKS